MHIEPKWHRGIPQLIHSLHRVKPSSHAYLVDAFPKRANVGNYIDIGRTGVLLAVVEQSFLFIELAVLNGKLINPGLQVVTFLLIARRTEPQLKLLESASEVPPFFFNLGACLLDLPFKLFLLTLVLPRLPGSFFFLLALYLVLVCQKQFLQLALQDNVFPESID